MKVCIKMEKNEVLCHVIFIYIFLISIHTEKNNQFGIYAYFLKPYATILLCILKNNLDLNLEKFLLRDASTGATLVKNYIIIS